MLLPLCSDVDGAQIGGPVGGTMMYECKQAGGALVQAGNDGAWVVLSTVLGPCRLN